jgi:glutaminyl-tRNA synthetase
MISEKIRRRSSFRLSPGREVRLRYAYFITCTSVVKDAGGTSSNCGVRTILQLAAEILRRAFSESDNALGFCGARRSGRDSHLRPLFTEERLNDLDDAAFKAAINPNSLEILSGSYVEQSPGLGKTRRPFSI